MKKATVTLTNIPEPSDIESNKTATIDVSEYTEPVEITPTQGKDGMAKATVTLSNIPIGGVTKFCTWADGSYEVYTVKENPEIGDTVYVLDDEGIKIFSKEIADVEGDTIGISSSGDIDYYERDSSKDIVF